ncbi:MAG TPA: hypothetical protein VGM56_04465 [Byssovorax sp.]|jgi:hypothetical protein
MVAQKLLVCLSIALAGALGCSSDPAAATSSSGQGGAGEGGGGDGGTVVIDKGPTGSIFADADTNDGGDTLVQAAFQRQLPSMCDAEVDGTCKFIDCSNAQMPAYVAAGTLDVSGANSPISADPTSGGAYYFEQGSTELWNSGTDLTFKFAGSTDVPAFSLTATSPPPPLVKDPMFADFGMVPITRAAGLDVTWSGLTDELMQVAFTNFDGSTQLVCAFDGASGKATVPAAALLRMDPSDDWVITIRATTEKTTKSGDFDVTLDLSARGVSANGTGADGEVLLH